MELHDGSRKIAVHKRELERCSLMILHRNGARQFGYLARLEGLVIEMELSGRQSPGDISVRRSKMALKGEIIDKSSDYCGQAIAAQLAGIRTDQQTNAMTGIKQRHQNTHPLSAKELKIPGSTSQK